MTPSCRSSPRGPASEQALSSQVITLDVIRQQVFASPQGENLLSVRAAWGDPETAYLLVEATVNGYLDLLAETVALDSVEAIDFWTEVRQKTQEFGPMRRRVICGRTS